MQQRTKRRYGPAESAIVLGRLLEERDEWAFRGRTEEHVLFRCPGCGEDSYRVYLDSGRASCSNNGCEEMPTKSEPLFAAVARLCGYDKQAQKAEVWGRIERELEAHGREERERELRERRALEARVGSLEGQLAVARGKASEASEAARDLSDRNAGLEEEKRQLLQVLGARANAETRNAGLAVAVVAFAGVLVWVTLFQEVAGVRPRAVVDLPLAAVVAGLLTAVFYQGAARETSEDLLWKPFYRRMDPEVLFSWTWKFLASFVAPLVLVDWLLGSERVRSALPVGTFGWEVLVTAAAVGLAARFFLWVSSGEARR